MKQVMLFGSRYCEGCGTMKAYLTRQGVEFTYFDIHENLLNLKAYLKFRDNNPEFDEIKRVGRVGIPCVVINNGEQFAFDEGELDIEALKG